jgi:hypothetical protein
MIFGALIAFLAARICAYVILPLMPLIVLLLSPEGV